VTVVIAAYNRSEVLRYALASALGQSYPKLEILVIGDACSDDSGEVVASFSDPRVRWINLPENSGSQAGPNQAGLELARGELVAYLGHDDLWRADHVALLVGHRQATGAGVVAAVCDNVWPGRLGARRFMSELEPTWTPPSSLLHDADLGRRAGGWRHHRQTVLPPDRDFVARCLAAGAAYSRVRALSVVKFASAQRPGSYVAHGSDEQARWARRIDRRTFVIREVLSGAALLPLRPWSPHPAIAAEARATPGGVVAELRRIRGLD
jgi:glycosyltransferase involved in cell wall biosynthesis